ncbi:hypothetical protein BIY24_08440 [Halobacteriovorax marinus]|uniref:sterol desaturase family protein n=1 Tax=Halobacteriovorax marinus TaxID=97084 RepID=UPI000BC35A58|nr:sterol desaturase family protein [Halobacteriovorax marinus]ATH07977.1 hypothetical protein BIY24_08440 [Halobacteriovorax marinus]
MDIKWWIELSIFSSLVLFTAYDSERRERLLKKKFDDWFCDLINLTIQGTIVPLIQVYFIVKVLKLTLPNFESTWQIGITGAIFLNLIIVDYVYYLTHKALHKDRWWGLHLLHHSVTDFDIFASARNTIWTTFLFPYVWLNSIFYFFIDNKKAYLVCASITAMLDLWRHSKLAPKIKGPIFNFLSLILITPHEHSWHHSKGVSKKNFGANLCIWDKLHGTYHNNPRFPKEMGYPIKSDLKTKLLNPFKLKRENS